MASKLTGGSKFVFPLSIEPPATFYYSLLKPN